MANPVVTFEMKNGEIMKAELYPEIAANTVRNFISLVQKGYYDGLIGPSKTPTAWEKWATPNAGTS